MTSVESFLAPNNAPTTSHCVGQALEGNTLAFGADALGAVPGEGQVLAGFQLGAAGVSFVNSLFMNDGPGAAGSIVAVKSFW
jgi:hypothetical protein